MRHNLIYRSQTHQMSISHTSLSFAYSFASSEEQNLL